MLSKNRGIGLLILMSVAVCSHKASGYTWHVFNGLPYDIVVQVETRSLPTQKRTNTIKPGEWGEFKFGGIHVGTCFKEVRLRKRGGYYKSVKKHHAIDFIYKYKTHTYDTWTKSRCWSGVAFVAGNNWDFYSASGDSIDKMKDRLYSFFRRVRKPVGNRCFDLKHPGDFRKCMKEHGFYFDKYL